MSSFEEPPSTRYEVLKTDFPHEIWVAIIDGALPLTGVFLDPISITLVAERDNEKIYRLEAPGALHAETLAAVDALMRCGTSTVPNAVWNLKKAILAWYKN